MLRHLHSSREGKRIMESRDLAQYWLNWTSLPFYTSDTSCSMTGWTRTFVIQMIQLKQAPHPFSWPGSPSPPVGGCAQVCSHSPLQSDCSMLHQTAFYAGVEQTGKNLPSERGKKGKKKKKKEEEINPQQEINAIETYNSGTSRLDEKVQLYKLKSKGFYLIFI